MVVAEGTIVGLEKDTDGDGFVLGNVLTPRFLWLHKREGIWATGKVVRILPNGCLVLQFLGKFAHKGDYKLFLADPAEAKRVSFDTCQTLVDKSFSHTQIEYSKYLGAAEECSSSESGWTMYIVSPMYESSYNIFHGYDHGHGHKSVYDHSHGDHHHGHGHGHGHVNDGIDKSYGDYSIYHNEDSDDSMVSDASSRPSRQTI
ncbi:hypothetical protein Tco_0539817 [Tanacetum coccineum]